LSGSGKVKNESPKAAVFRFRKENNYSYQKKPRIDQKCHWSGMVQTQQKVTDKIFASIRLTRSKPLSTP